jgi:hypothetical protein
VKVKPPREIVPRFCRIPFGVRLPSSSCLAGPCMQQLCIERIVSDRTVGRWLGIIATDTNNAACISCHSR